MNLTASIDAYCERLGPEFWAEPINAITNLAFILAALIGIREAKRRGVFSRWVIVLCALAFCIGVGSFLFHTFAQRWSAIADVVPILLFILAYLFAAAHYLFGLRWLVAIPAAIIAFGLASLARNGVLLLATKEQLNGSEGYAPALALLLGAAIILSLMKHPAGRWIAAASGVFVVSLIARSTDISVCQSFSLGTHFLWHCLNGLMIGLLLLGMIRHGSLARSHQTAV